MSAGNINILLRLWNASLTTHHDQAPFRNHKTLYNLIDAIPYGDVPWRSLTIKHPLNEEEGPRPPWMEEQQVVWYRDPLQVLREIISNPDFMDEFDYVPYHKYSADGIHQFRNVMSGDWAWRQAVSTNHLPFFLLTLQVDTYRRRPGYSRCVLCPAHSQKRQNYGIRWNWEQ